MISSIRLIVSLLLVSAAAYLPACKSGGGSPLDDAGRPSADDSETPADTGTGDRADTGTGSIIDTGTEPDDTGSASTCAGVRCNAPPDNVCSGEFDIQIYNRVGWCDDGDCFFAAHVETCIGTCEGGVCTGAPCQGVVCRQAPTPVCVNGDTLKVFNNVGYCAATSGMPLCHYASRDIACEEGCEDGRCAEDPCAHVLCDDTPAQYCDEDDLVMWNAPPYCSEGECEYTPQRVVCAGECEDGHCPGEELCDGVVCDDRPASFCLDQFTLRAFQDMGACDGGACIYAPLDISCASGCEGGQCVDEPCAGVMCDSPPASRCADGDTLLSWDGAPGACDDGVCAYGVEEIECLEGCVNGRCADDPCAGVHCISPPPTRCADGDTLVSYDAVGTCDVEGRCLYTAEETTCEDGCEAGSCRQTALDTDSATETGADGDADADADTDTDTDTDADTDTDTDTDVDVDTDADTDADTDVDADADADADADVDVDSDTDANVDSETATETLGDTDTGTGALETRRTVIGLTSGGGWVESPSYRLKAFAGGALAAEVESASYRLTVGPGAGVAR